MDSAAAAVTTDSAVTGADGPASSGTTPARTPSGDAGHPQLDSGGASVELRAAGPSVLAGDAGLASGAEKQGSEASDAANAVQALASLSLVPDADMGLLDVDVGGLMSDIDAVEKSVDPAKGPVIRATAPQPGAAPLTNVTVEIKKEMIDGVAVGEAKASGPPGPPVTIDMTVEDEAAEPMQVDGDQDSESKAVAEETGGRSGVLHAAEAKEDDPMMDGENEFVRSDQEVGVSEPALTAHAHAVEMEPAAPPKSKAKSKASPKAKAKAKSKRTAPAQDSARSKRSKRPAAVAAEVALVDQAVREREDDVLERRQQKRQQEIIEIDDDDEGEFVDEPSYSVSDVKYLVARRMDPSAEPGSEQRQYLAVWENPAPGEVKSSWIQVADMVTGLDRWVKFVDTMYQQLKGKDGDILDFHAYLSKSLAGMKMTFGTSADFTCVYDAVKVLMRLTESELELTETMVREFETKKRLDRLKEEGLSFNLVNEFLGFFMKLGWPYEIGRNLHNPSKFSGMGAIVDGIEAGRLYLAGTADRLKRGHCVVVEVTKAEYDVSEVFLHEDGKTIPLLKFDGAEKVVFVREIRRRSALRGQDEDEEMALEDGSKKEAVRPVKVATARKTRRSRKKRRIVEEVD